MTQNDPMVAVALTPCMPYRQAYAQAFPNFQNSDFCGADNRFGHEFAPVDQCRIHAACGQIRTFGRLCRVGGAGAFRLAKALGRNNFYRIGNIWHWNRIRSTFHGDWQNRLSCGHARQSARRGARPHSFSFFLDTTPTLTRRFPCAA